MGAASATMTTARWARLMVGTMMVLLMGTASFAATGQETSTTQTTAPSSSSQPAESTTTEPPVETTTTTAAATESTSIADDGQVTTTSAPPESDATTASSSAERAREKATAIANLNLAKAADIEIARELDTINQAANETLEKIDKATKRIEAADAVVERTEEQLAESERRRGEIEDELRVKAVEGFKTRVLGEPSPLFTKGDVNRAIRQNTLLDQASLSTTDLLEELRILQDDREIANAEATLAKEEAEEAEAVLQEELAVYQEQKDRQLGLKAEAERRIDIWAGELAAYAREDAAVQRVIADNAGKTPVQSAAQQAPAETQSGAPAASPTPASASGFQWPLNARVTSEFGYRVHPIYGSRRLHAGVDIGAPSGTPIAAANDGVVIFAGSQGGYGRTVIVDHGGSITTLYAHQSSIGAGKGQVVARGDIIGYVGATGTATGNHLHFEVRVNGSPNNPRNYLP